MAGVRWVAGRGPTSLEPCSRCQTTGCPWDRIAGKPICPDCQEALVLGDGPALIERAESNGCSVCRQTSTLRYLTYPLQVREAIEMDLCSHHVQALLARRLERNALVQLGRQLRVLGVESKQVFLLHEAFYDEKGRALQPVPEEY